LLVDNYILGLRNICIVVFRGHTLEPERDV